MTDRSAQITRAVRERRRKTAEALRLVRGEECKLYLLDALGELGIEGKAHPKKRNPAVYDIARIILGADLAFWPHRRWQPRKARQRLETLSKSLDRVLCALDALRQDVSLGASDLEASDVGDARGSGDQERAEHTARFMALRALKQVEVRELRRGSGAWEDLIRVAGNYGLVEVTPGSRGALLGVGTTESFVEGWQRDALSDFSARVRNAIELVPGPRGGGRILQDEKKQAVAYWCAYVFGIHKPFAHATRGHRESFRRFCEAVYEMHLRQVAPAEIKKSDAGLKRAAEDIYKRHKARPRDVVGLAKERQDRGLDLLAAAPK